VTHSTNLWQWLGHYANEQFTEYLSKLRGYNFPPPPRRAQETGWADDLQFDEFQRHVPSQVPLGVERSSLDSISLYGEYRKSTGALVSFSCVGEYDPTGFKLALGLHKLASAVLLKPESRNALASVARYFKGFC
jgi:hypothetical protein